MMLAEIWHSSFIIISGHHVQKKNKKIKLRVACTVPTRTESPNWQYTPPRHDFHCGKFGFFTNRYTFKNTVFVI